MKICIVSHIMTRGKRRYEGPFSTIIKNFESLNEHVDYILLPLDLDTCYIVEKFGGKNTEESKITFPKIITSHIILKYIFDIFYIFLSLLKNYTGRKQEDLVIISIDPLSTLPTLLLKAIFGYKVIFYSVDFNVNRFSNKFVQYLYQLSDRLASRYSDQTWAVCQSIIDYKKQTYDVTSLYVPNSFGGSYFESNIDLESRTLNKVVWTGSALTIKQVKDIIKIAQSLHDLRSDLEFTFLPSNFIDDFKSLLSETRLNWKVVVVSGQTASREIVKTCDIGLAIYDDEFGSTEFIEPIKVWEYMICKIPFIISYEPSLNEDFVNTGVAIKTSPHNNIDSKSEMTKFISAENLKVIREKCFWMRDTYRSDYLMVSLIKNLLNTATE